MIAHEDAYAVPRARLNTWTRTHTPAVSTLATISKDAPGSGKRLVVTGFSVTVGAGATAPTATVVTVSLTTSAGRTLWANKLGAAATAASISGIARSGSWPCVEGESVTLAFSGTATNVEESVTMEGYEEDVA